MLNNRKKLLTLALLISISLLFSFSRVNSTAICLRDNGSNYTINNDSLYCSLHETQITFDDVDKIKVEESIAIENLESNPVSEIDLYFPHYFKNLIILDKEYGLLSYSNTSDILSVELALSLSRNDSTYFTLYYDLFQEYYVEIIESKPASYSFTFAFQISFDTARYNLDILLPVQSFISDVSNPYSPNAVVTPIHNRIHLSWVIRNLYYQEQRSVYVKYDAPHSNNTPVWVFVISSSSCVFAGAGITYLIVKRNQRKTMQKIGNIFLTEAQKTLLIIITERGGTITQGDLVRLTGFSKSKVSRNLAPLEENNFIEREKWGNQYKVSITDQGKKVIE